MKTIYLFFTLILIGMQSCGERTLIRHYYIMELPEETYISNQDTMLGKGICEILKTRIPPAYDQQRIANRRQSHEISYYQYHYWAMNPAENLTSLLEQQIKLSHIFSYSSRENFQGVPNYQIASEVYRIEVEDKDDLFYLRMAMRLELFDYKKGNVVVTHKFDRAQELVSRDLNLFASELSVIFQDEMHTFIEKIRSYLAKTNSLIPSE